MAGRILTPKEPGQPEMEAAQFIVGNLMPMLSAIYQSLDMALRVQAGVVTRNRLKAMIEEADAAIGQMVEAAKAEAGDDPALD